MLAWKDVAIFTDSAPPAAATPARTAPVFRIAVPNLENFDSASSAERPADRNAPLALSRPIRS
jgi:hypothetical protein